MADALNAPPASVEGSPTAAPPITLTLGITPGIVPPVSPAAVQAIPPPSVPQPTGQLTDDQLSEAQKNVSTQPQPTGQLTDDQLAEAQKNATTGDILQDASADELAKLATEHPGEFDPVGIYLQSDPAVQSDPAIREKVRNTFNQLQQSGLFSGVTPASAWDAVKKTISGLVRTPVETGYRLGTGIEEATARTARVLAGGSGAPTVEELGKSLEQKRTAAELAIANEINLVGAGQQAKKALKWLRQKAVQGLGPELQKAIAPDMMLPKDFTPEQKEQALQDEISSRGVMARAAKGPEFPGMRVQTATKELAEAGLPVRPGRVEELAAGSPFMWEGMGKVLGGATGLAGAAIPVEARAAAAATLDKISKGLPTVVGKTIAGTGTAAEKTAEVAELVSSKLEALEKNPIVRTGALLLGHHAGGPIGAIVGSMAGEIGEKLTSLAAKYGGNLADLGEQVAGETPIRGATAPFIRDVLQAGPAAVAQTGMGSLFDMGLLAATTDTPQDRQGFVPFGTVLGAVGAAKQMGHQVLSGQIVTPRDFGTDQRVASTKNFPDLAQAHENAYRTAAPGLRRRVNALRQFAAGVDPNSEFFYLPGDEEDAGNTLAAAGLPPEWAGQDGFFSKQVKGADGQTHNVIIARDLDAAPHELMHGMDAVLGGNGIAALNQQAKGLYTPEEWNAFKQRYVDLMANRPGVENPDAFILNNSNRGNNVAREKIYRQIQNALLDETGTMPSTAELRDAGANRIQQLQGEADQAGISLWEHVLDPQEQQTAVDNYIGSELRAENGAAWFNAGRDATGLAGKMARATAHMVALFGGEPLAGRTSRLGAPLKFGLVRGAAEQAKQIFKARGAQEPLITPKAPTTPVAKPPAVTAPPGSAEERQQRADQAQAISTTAPPDILEGADMSQQDIAGEIAKAIAAGSPLALQYRSAPDVPAAASALGGITKSVGRGVRRALIEAGRYLPEEAREMLPKTFTPELLRRTKEGKYQVNGWTPEVLFANAQKLAEFAVAHPEFRPDLFGPGGRYEVEPGKKSFAVNGWRNLVDDVETFSANQSRGYTGSGEPLVVPRSVGKGYFKPPEKGEPAALNQQHADVINALFGLAPQTTGFIAKEGAIPLNLAGQRISEATLGGRVSPEGGPEFGTKGEKQQERARKLGITGEQVREVNPFREELNRHDDAPSFIEARQWLNLEHMAHAEQAPEQPGLRGNTLTLEAGFSPKPVVEIEGPDGKKYRATHDGFMDFTALGKGMVPQYTALEDFPGGPIKGSTTYGPSLEKKGFKVPPPVEQQAPQFSPAPNEEVRKVATDYIAPPDRPFSEQKATTINEAQFTPGKTPLVHYSEEEGLKELRPEMYGRGIAGAEAARKKNYPELWADRTYLGTKEYQKEPALGNVRYKALVRSGSLYDFYEDPKDLYPTPQEVEKAGYAPMDEGAAATLYEKKIRDAGFEGYVSKDGAVAKFTPTKVKQLAEGAQFSPSKYEPQERTPEDRENRLTWGSLDMLAAEGYTPTKKTAAKLAALKKAGVKSFDVKSFGTWHNPVFALVKSSDTSGKYPATIEGITAAGKQAAKDEAKAFEYSRKMGVSWDYGGEAHFSPKPEAFTDEKTLADALKQPGWSILTATMESLGPGTNEANTKRNADLEAALKAGGYDYKEVQGSYKGVDQGRNFLVTGITPRQALELGKNWGQESVVVPQGLLYADGSLNPAAPERTKVGKDAEKEDFVSRLPGGPAFSLGLDFSKKVPAKFGDEFQLTGESRSPLTSKEAAEMTDEELKSRYPEALVPKRHRGPSGNLIEPSLGSDIVGSPLNKAEGVKGFVKRLVDMARSWETHPAYQSGLKWYSEFTPMLKKHFAGHEQTAAELLAATSPQTAPDQNFAYANDALEMFKRGKYDKQISKYVEGLEKIENGTWEKWLSKNGEGDTKEAFIKAWIQKHNLLPVQSNGKLFGHNSRAVLNVVAGKWSALNKGPKTANFVQNLLGTGHEATIDVWADRTMRRLGYEGQPGQDRWRILPKNQAGVSDEDFAFSQDAFRQAAKELGVMPDALQGALWFAEKQHWSDRGWGKLDLGDFRKEFEKLPMLRQGIEQRLATQKKIAKAKPTEQLELVSPR